MIFWRGFLYAIAVIMLTAGGLILILKISTKRPWVPALAYFGGASALLAFALPAIAAA